MGKVHIVKEFSHYIKEKGYCVSMKIGFDLQDPTALQIKQESHKAVRLCKKLVDDELEQMK